MSTVTKRKGVKALGKRSKSKAAHSKSPAKVATHARARGGLPSHRILTAASNKHKMLGDPTRLGLLVLLADGEKNVGELCRLVDHSQPAVSHHLSLLLHGGLVGKRRDGKNNIYYINDPAVAEIVKGTETLAERPTFD